MRLVGVEQSVVPDLAFFLYTLLFVLLPINTLWTDCFLAASWGCFYAVWLSSSSVSSLRTPYGYSLFPTIILTQSGIGVHSSVVIAMAVAGIAFMVGLDGAQSNANHTWVVQSAGWSLVACCLTVAFELLTATSFHAWREQLTVSSRLADTGFDGCLTVDVITGRIRSANLGLERLLGPDVAGREPADFVQARDREAVVRLYREAEEHLGRSVMSTYVRRAADGSATAEFESRLVGYHLADNCLRMILQVIGEVRVVEPQQGASPELAIQRRREQQAADRALADRVWRSVAQSRGGRQADMASAADSRVAVVERQPQALASLLDAPER